MSLFADHLQKIEQGASLSQEEMFSAIGFLLQGLVPEPQMESFLVALAERGETEDEITGAARALRAMATTLNVPEDTLDCCGTGGDGMGTLNISTAVALIAAACGVTVAKHGNRAMSSKSGAADVLEQLGVNLDAAPEKLERALRDTGFCFLMAPHHHAAMKNVAAVRRKLERRTLFNLLGPLANPAGAKRQLVGVFSPALLAPIARTLQNLGCDKAWVVHGADGLDEISLSGDTHIAILENGAITERTLTPKDFGLSKIDNGDIEGGGPVRNAAALLSLLEGKKGAYRDIVLANAAAALMVADKAASLKDGVAMAAAALDEGRALSVLTRYKAATA